MLHGSAKAVAVRELAERFGLDLARCSAYSDSFNDLPMLEQVGDPCAINPDSRLREHARSTAGGSATTAPAARQRGPGWSPPPSRAPLPARSLPAAAIRRKVR